MRVFVTGGAGYIGSVVCEELGQAGYQVVAFDNLQSGHRRALDPSIPLIVGDLRDPAEVSSALREAQADAVMHFAAESIVFESYEDPGKHFKVNHCGGLNLLEAMRNQGVSRLVFSSTAAVYGEPAQMPITEETPTLPVNPYGESKLQFERVLPWYERTYGLQHVSLRYFNACGATDRNGECRPRETHLIPILLDVLAGKRERFTLFGEDYPTPDGTCIRDYVHVSDIAAAHRIVLERLAALPSRVYNLGTGIGASNREVMAAAESVAGRKLACDVAPRRRGDPAALVASAEKIARDLNWRPRHTDLKAMIADAWRWLQANPNGYQNPDKVTES